MRKEEFRSNCKWSTEVSWSLQWRLQPLHWLGSCKERTTWAMETAIDGRISAAPGSPVPSVFFSDVWSTQSTVYMPNWWPCQITPEMCLHLWLLCTQHTLSNVYCITDHIQPMLPYIPFMRISFCSGESCVSSPSYMAENSIVSVVTCLWNFHLCTTMSQQGRGPKSCSGNWNL